MFQEIVNILYNRRVGSSYYRLGLTCNPGYTRSRPGQFVMIRTPDGGDPILRRPFSIHALIVRGGAATGIEILYKTVGPCTTRLAEAREGERLDMIGPLGRGFNLPENTRRVLIGAGGIGAAPTLFLVRRMREIGIDLENCRVFLGGRSEADLLCRKDFLGLGIPVHITTDDGSAGEHCFLTDPLEAAVRKAPPDLICACGPMGMLKCIAGIAERHRVPCQISIETLMACGIGACLGCAVEGSKPGNAYLHACSDGPVFDAGALRLV
jgi:dihydroorotate dehydrogenase electron transfer subunit